jgi:hypothetical protein
VSSTTAVSSTLRGDAADQRPFIEAVLREQSGNVVMALVGSRLANGKPRVNRPTWFRYPEQLDQMEAFAIEHLGDDLYLSPIAYGDKRGPDDQPSREKHNALTCQVIYMDSDTCPPSAFRLKPSIHVDTSPGRGHDYWVLPAPISADEAAALAHRISIAHKKDGTDPSGWSASKFLRMPTVNLSYGEARPVTWHDTGEIYSDLDIAGAYDDIAIDAIPMSGPSPAPGVLAKDVRTAATEMPELITGEALAPLYDRVPATNLKLIDLLEHKPKAGDTGWRSEQRWALLLELMRTGFTVQETMSIAWHAAASGKWHEDPRGLAGLWYELQKAAMQVRRETGADVAPAERKAVHGRGPKLLKPMEMKRVERYEFFVDDYLSWADSRVAVLNRPLHEINGWTILSAAHSVTGYIWKPTDPLRLNIYSTTVAPSSSGKSEASRMMRRVLNRFYPRDSVLIGADHSRNALIQVLNDRDGLVSVAQSDEGDETLNTQAHQNWAAGMQQAWTEVYDGEVPQQGRIQAKDQKAKAKSTALVIMHLVGTPEGIYSTVDRQMFKSGYLARHVWVEGVRVPVTRESIAVRRRSAESEAVNDHDMLPRYWQHLVALARRRVMNLADPKPVPIDFTDEAAERLSTARFEIVAGLDKLNDEAVLSPIANRMLDITYKVCGLLALSDGRAVVTMPDVLRALAQVQEWLDTAIRVVDKIAASSFSRACDEIEAFIASREAGEAMASQIYALMKGSRPRDVNEYLESLTVQGRVEAIQPQSGGPRRYKIKGDLA